eukprot:scaffold90866_cov61-Phaeocystis_antarctica.AAC.6
MLKEKKKDKTSEAEVETGTSEGAAGEEGPRFSFHVSAPCSSCVTCTQNVVFNSIQRPIVRCFTTHCILRAYRRVGVVCSSLVAAAAQCSRCCRGPAHPPAPTHCHSPVRAHGVPQTPVACAPALTAAPCRDPRRMCLRCARTSLLTACLRRWVARSAPHVRHARGACARAWRALRAPHTAHRTAHGATATAGEQPAVRCAQPERRAAAVRGRARACVRAAPCVPARQAGTRVV